MTEVSRLRLRASLNLPGAILSHEGLVYLRAEADVERLAFLDGRRTQVPRRTKKMARQRVVARGVLLHVESDDLLAARDVNRVRRPRQRERLGPALLLLAGIGGVFDLDRVLLKEPLSPLARRSALAVIHPIDGMRHDILP